MPRSLYTRSAPELPRILSFFRLPEQSAIKKLIHRFKFDGARTAGDDLFSLIEARLPELLRLHCEENEAAGKFTDLSSFSNGESVTTPNRTFLVPVPLTRARERGRGLHQTRQLARAISAATGLPLFEGLKKVRETPPQSSLTRTARLGNLAGVFALQESLPVPSRTTFLLVDDVLTTGSTLNACARTLRAAGAEKVEALTLAQVETVGGGRGENFLQKPEPATAS